MARDCMPVPAKSDKVKGTEGEHAVSVICMSRVHMNTIFRTLMQVLAGHPFRVYAFDWHDRAGRLYARLVSACLGQEAIAGECMAAYLEFCGTYTDNILGDQAATRLVLQATEGIDPFAPHSEDTMMSMVCQWAYDRLSRREWVAPMATIAAVHATGGSGAAQGPAATPRQRSTDHVCLAHNVSSCDKKAACPFAHTCWKCKTPGHVLGSCPDATEAQKAWLRAKKVTPAAGPRFPPS
jgi:hypothetical protein